MARKFSKRDLKHVLDAVTKREKCCYAWAKTGGKVREMTYSEQGRHLARAEYYLKCAIEGWRERAENLEGARNYLDGAGYSQKEIDNLFRTGKFLTPNYPFLPYGETRSRGKRREFL